MRVIIRILPYAVLTVAVIVVAEELYYSWDQGKTIIAAMIVGSISLIFFFRIAARFGGGERDEDMAMAAPPRMGGMGNSPYGMGQMYAPPPIIVVEGGGPPPPPNYVSPQDDAGRVEFTDLPESGYETLFDKRGRRNGE